MQQNAFDVLGFGEIYLLYMVVCIDHVGSQIIERDAVLVGNLGQGIGVVV